MYEIVYLNGNKVPSKLYEDKETFIHDFQILDKKGIPFKASGTAKDGGIAVVTRNGWSDDDVILTAIVDFGYGKTYSYAAGKRYFGKYEVLTKYGKSVVTVTYKWRQIDDFRAELWALGYDEPVSFESVLIRKVVSK